MPERIYGFTEDQIARLRRVADAVDGADTFSPTNARRAMHARPRSYVGFLDFELAGTSGPTAPPTGPALFKVYSFSSTGTVDTGMEIFAYNFAPQAATTDRWAIVELCGITGNGIVTTQFTTDI